MLTKIKSKSSLKYHHSHFDFEVIENSDEIKAQLSHSGVDKICREVLSIRLLARESHMEEDTPRSESSV